MSKIEFYSNKIIVYGLYAILLTPLALWSKALFPFLTPKFILFQVLVEIVFAAWLLLVIFNCEYRPKFNWLVISLLAFIGVSFISALFGVDFSRSFWGIGARLTGLFAELHFLAWFLVLGSSLCNSNQQIHSNSTNESKGIRSIRMSFVDLNRYINFSFVVSVIVALTAFYTNLQLRLALGNTVFGNPTFVAPYLIFHFFWGVYQAFTSRKWQWLFGTGSALIFFVILLGQIRGAILGLFAGILLLNLFFIFSDAVNRRFKIALAALFILLFVGLFNVWIFRDSQFIQNTSILKRLTQFSLSEPTAQTRILAWQVALKGFASASWRTALLGAGPENFNFVFNTHYSPRFLKFGGGGFGETWFDKPHDAYLQILTETGVIGAAAYILIWLAAAFSLFKLFKSGQKILSLALTSAFISYLTSMIFSFDSFGSWFGLFLMLGFLASHSNSNLQIYSNTTNKFVEFGYIRRLGLFIVLISALFLIYLNYSIWRANIADADALRTFPRDPAQGVVLFKKSLNYFSPYKSEYQFDLIASVGGAIEKGILLPSLEDTINFALDEADKAVAAHPKDAAKYTDMTRIYNILGTVGRDPQILAQAEMFGRKSLELSPNRQETLFYLARTALLENNFKSAVALTKQAVDLDPEVGLGHWYLGLSYIANNQKENGLTEIKKALEMGYEPQNQIEKDFIKNFGL